MLNTLTDTAFKSEVLESKGNVLVKFGAEWCGPCRQLDATLKEVANDMSSEVKFYLMDIDENPETPSQFGVKGIPTVVLFQDGKKMDIKVGSMPKGALTSWIKDTLSL
jgi:thioredoxin 1